MSPSLWNILIIILVVAVLFGGVGRIPAIARMLGRAMGEFKKGVKEGEEEKEGKEPESIEKKEERK